MQKKIDIQYHMKALEVIGKYGNTIPGTLSRSKSSLDDQAVEMQPYKKSFTVSFQYDRGIEVRRRLGVGQCHKAVTFITSGETLVFESIYLRRHSPPNFKGDVDFFYTKGYSKKKKYYYRLLVPLSVEVKFHYQLEESFFETDIGYQSRLGTRSVINKDTIYVSIIQDPKSKKHYLNIESEVLQDYDSFSEKSFAVKTGLAYLTGYMAGDNGFFFAYTRKEKRAHKHYYFTEFRDTIKSGYTPIHTNPYSYLRGNRKMAERYERNKVLRPVSIVEFSLLCQRLHDFSAFSIAILLMLESSVASLVFMPGGFAITLETIADIITGDEKQKLSPIHTNSLSKQIRESCMEVLNNYKTDISEENFKVLSGRVNQLNQVTNKSRLRAPFKMLGIVLSPEDEAILESRNDFLHGRIPDITKAGKNRTLDRKNRDLYYASMRFYTLLNMLILKWVGFDSYILNHPKIQEKYCKIKLKELPYRKV